ncbi:hypothetical protein [Rhodocaloribacter sp.]
MEEPNQTLPVNQPESGQTAKKPFEEPEVVSQGEIQIFGGSGAFGGP